MQKSESGLYWGEQGNICCQKHSPFYRSDTWNNERWCPVPVTEETIREELSCEVCGQKMKVIIEVA